MQVEPEPLPVNVDPNAAPKIFAFIEDLFFVAKDQRNSTEAEP